uniref:Uncharacterized protein n=1 Tax=Macrostomum lignano TaxID=282301 RepID=A0A1I8FNA5_9PLAT
MIKCSAAQQGESQRCNSFDAMFVDKTEDEMAVCCKRPGARARRIAALRQHSQSLNGAEPQTEPLQQQSKDSAASGHDKACIYSNLLLMQRSRSEMLSGLRLVQPLIAGPMPSAALRASLLNAIKSGGGGGGGGKTAASRIGAGVLGQARDGSQSPAAAAALDRALELLRQAGGDSAAAAAGPWRSDGLGLRRRADDGRLKTERIKSDHLFKPGAITTFLRLWRKISRVLGLALCL